MIDQAYRVIKTLEANLSLLMEFGVIKFTHKDDIVKCPFCKASKNKIIRKHKNFNKIKMKTVIDHAKDCELKYILSEMEEWGCK